MGKGSAPFDARNKFNRAQIRVHSYHQISSVLQLESLQRQVDRQMRSAPFFSSFTWQHRLVVEKNTRSRNPASGGVPLATSRTYKEQGHRYHMKVLACNKCQDQNSQEPNSAMVSELDDPNCSPLIARTVPFHRTNRANCIARIPQKINDPDAQGRWHSKSVPLMTSYLSCLFRLRQVTIMRHSQQLQPSPVRIVLSDSAHRAAFF